MQEKLIKLCIVNILEKMRGGSTVREDLETSPPIEEGLLYKETLREELISF